MASRGEERKKGKGGWAGGFERADGGTRTDEPGRKCREAIPGCWREMLIEGGLVGHGNWPIGSARQKGGFRPRCPSRSREMSTAGFAQPPLFHLSSNSLQKMNEISNSIAWSTDQHQGLLPHDHRQRAHQTCTSSSLDVNSVCFVASPIPEI